MYFNAGADFSVENNDIEVSAVEDSRERRDASNGDNGICSSAQVLMLLFGSLFVLTRLPLKLMNLYKLKRHDQGHVKPNQNEYE